MLSSFSIALSALSAHETAIDVTGNNLANLNTPGYKASVVEFSDLVSRTVGSGLGETQVGFGVGTPRTLRDFTQGPIQPSGQPMSAAIQGRGFFVLEGADGSRTYTRVGSFKVDKEGNLVTSSGQRVLGWSATDGVVNSSVPPKAISVPVGSTLKPKATTEMSLDMNLSSQAVNGQPSGTVEAPVEVVDSLGAKHLLTITFTKNAAPATSWGYTANMPTGHGTATCTGTLTFDSDGQLQFAGTPPDTTNTITITGLPGGAADMSVEWNLAAANLEPRITQYAVESSISNPYQNGYAAAGLVQFSIGDGGAILAEYDNGQQQVMGQLALASFRNPDTLIGAGDNAFMASAATADPAIGPAESGGRGKIKGGYMEGSTVDIAREFTNLIVYQRGYQANSRVITTADEISQETINLKR